MACWKTPHNCSMHWMRARISIRSCNRCATSTNSTIESSRRLTNLPPACLKAATTRLRQQDGERRMKLYDSLGPNPRIVRMFMAEKGIEMPKQPVDLRKGENREAEHLKRNPHGQMPTLELDNGSYLSEITAICEYLEEKHPQPAMIGATPEQ